MGLPNSSISQCRRLEVWTWQNGPDNAMFSYLDVDEIESSLLCHVPKPTHRKLPKEWHHRSSGLGSSGTLVLWSNFDRSLTWRGSKATLRNTEIIVGRMYRKFINENGLMIRLLSLSDSDNNSPSKADVIDDRIVKVNDPMYLMRNSSTPAPFDIEPMFQSWGTLNKDERFSIEYDGKNL